MTLLLASVRDADEAEIAVADGADIIDLKDPSQGALGALSPDAVEAVVRSVAGRRPVSAVTGDRPMQPEIVVAAAARMAQAGVDYVKVGLFPGPGREECIRALSGVARDTKLVGVMFADAEADMRLLPLMAECGFAGVMIDTARKGAGSLLDHVDLAALEDFVVCARANGLMAGLAGSLEAPDIPRLLLLDPDFLGFRRALCADHDRGGSIDPAAVRLIRELIPLDPRSRVVAPSAGKRDQHPIAWGYAAERDPEGGTDRIFVHDFVIPVRVGAYAREREKPQNVRFNVDATIIRHSRAIETMRDVVSYDVIMDGIRLVVARAHTPLVETIAERVASFLLVHPRVINVTVRVEKLDVGPGAVGVEIRRERKAEVANVYQLYTVTGGATRSNAAE
jgi:dihydroneopterin aldolase